MPLIESSGGHKSLSILFRFTHNLLSVRDPGSWLASSQHSATAARDAGQMLNQNNHQQFAGGCFDFAAGPRGLEPRSAVLETDILPLNYRPVCTVRVIVSVF